MQSTFRFSLFLFILYMVSACSDEPSKTATATPAKETPDSLRFENDIRQMEASDQLNGIRKGGVVFTGSSSIRMWDSLAADMAPMPVLNRGFGGSTLPELDHYLDRIVFPYEPSVVVIYCGENDIAAGASAETSLQSFLTVMDKIENRLGKIPLAYIGMKPSIARREIWPEYQRANAMIQKEIDGHANWYYLDSGGVMTDSDGIIDPTIFIADSLHMNRSGYERWRALVYPLVDSLYQTQTDAR